MTHPRARVLEVNGQLILEDPDALALVRVVAKHNCRGTMALHTERLVHFSERLQAVGPLEYAIVILNVDDAHGAAMAARLMPGHDWTAVRGQGLTPYARGLALREWLHDVLDTFDTEASTKLRGRAGLSVVVVDYGVAEVFECPT